MNIVQIEENVKQLIHKIAQDKLKQQDFIYELLLAYGHRSQTIGRVRNGERNLAEDKENTVFWKRQIYFKIAKQHDLHGLIDQMKCEKRTESNKIRFLIVTDFKTLLAVDTKTQDTLDVPFNDLAKKFDFFLPWAGMEKAVYQGENPADVKAAEKLAKLFDEIKADNFNEDDLNNKENLHHLNIFLSRLLFCYFAEDTEIFKDKQFTSAISKSNEDGSDLSALIGRLFKVLNQSSEDREADLPDYLADFPYVNGGLFKDDIQVPKFTRKSRRILIECGAELDWSDINPDIFGSMFQAVVHTEQRSTMGQHYTSVPNIMKVIEPLFLNDLYEELEKNQDSVNKLLKLQQRLGKLKFFDPACGSGNFLIIAYKELRKFEMELLKRVQELELEKTGQFSKPFSVIQVSQFYGIEIDDFAHEIAILSLWLAEHQMNSSFKVEFGELIPALPLKHSGNIVNANAATFEWTKVCDPNGETYILGNPPYYGTRNQKKNHKEDILQVAGGFNNYKSFDYISCWFINASRYLRKNSTAKFAFVSTNSICQGDQVGILWPVTLLDDLEIYFAYKDFKWTNNAKKNAGVTCVVIGIRKKSTDKKIIISDGLYKEVKNINYYLTEGENIVVTRKSKPLNNLPKMIKGSIPTDGGFLIIDEHEFNELNKDTVLKDFIKPFFGAQEFLKGIKRWCFYLNEQDYLLLKDNPVMKKRFDGVKATRLKSTKKTTIQLAAQPWRFDEDRYYNKPCIIVPCTTSERREYIPMGFVDAGPVIYASAQAIYTDELWVFALLNSKLHMCWVKAVSGQLESRIRYSSSICYNTFPVPKLTNENINKLTESTFKIISEREKFTNIHIGDLYDPETMPESLRKAHQDNDQLVDSIYCQKGFKTDEERLAMLFNLYKKTYSE